MLGLCVGVEAWEEEVDAEVGPEHDDKSDDAEPCGDESAIADAGLSDVDDDEVDDPGDERPSFLRVECPPTSPRVICPPGAEEDADAESPEGELKDGHGCAIEIAERALRAGVDVGAGAGRENSGGGDSDEVGTFAEEFCGVVGAEIEEGDDEAEGDESVTGEDGGDVILEEYAGVEDRSFAFDVCAWDSGLCCHDEDEESGARCCGAEEPLSACEHDGEADEGGEEADAGH